MDTPASPGQPATTPAPAAAPRRLKKRWLICGSLLAIFAVLLVWAYVRGTWADTTPRDPASAADGVVCHLYRTPEGHTPTRCAVVLEYPVDQVWKVVTDYAHYHEIFPTLSSTPVKVVVDPDGRHHLTGVAGSVLGDWPFEVRIAEEKLPAKYAASWKESGGDVLLNRGSWVLTPKDGGKTLLVYSLEVELRKYPTFLVRNILISRQPGVVEAVIKRLKG
jgi:hypothetical protein